MPLQPWSVEGMLSFSCLWASNLPLTLVGKGTWPFWISFIGVTSNNDSNLPSWDTISMKQRLSLAQTNIQWQFQFFVAKWLPSPLPLLYATLDIIKYHRRRRKWRLSVIHFTRTNSLIVGCLANLKGEMCQNPGGSVSNLSSSHPGLSPSVATWVISSASGFVTVALHESPECPIRFREHIQTLLRGTQSLLSFALLCLISVTFIRIRLSLSDLVSVLCMWLCASHWGAFGHNTAISLPPCACHFCQSSLACSVTDPCQTTVLDFRPEILGAKWFLAARGTPTLARIQCPVSTVWCGCAQGRTEFCLCSFN